MARTKIIVTDHDHHRLENLLDSDLINAIGDQPSLKALRGELAIAEVVASSDVPPDVVTMNSTVRLRDVNTGEVDTYTLVYPEEARIADGKLSILAPIGTAILGYRVGDQISWQVPNGSTRMQIEEVIFQPERASAEPQLNSDVR